MKQISSAFTTSNAPKPMSFSSEPTNPAEVQKRQKKILILKKLQVLIKYYPN